MVFEATVLVDFESHSFDGLALDALLVLVVGSRRHANDLPVGVIDLLPEREEVLEHDLVALVDDQDAVFIRFEARHALAVVEPGLCLRLGLEQDREESGVLLLVTRFQAFVGVHHIDMHI